MCTSMPTHTHRERDAFIPHIYTTHTLTHTHTGAFVNIYHIHTQVHMLIYTTRTHTQVHMHIYTTHTPKESKKEENKKMWLSGSLVEDWLS